MTSQSELILEQNLISQLAANGYDKVTIKDESDLLVNLKKQLEKHNNKVFSDSDFKQILNHLSKSNNIFEKALLLRDKFAFKNDNNELVYVEFINMDFWCQNEYQVTNQITVEGTYKNRYDVTILINGLPLVQIELKKTGIELKEAYNQINRYQKHSFSSNTGLFNFVQLFVISNGVNTKYFSNFGNKKPDFKQTFYWTDDNNKRISKLEDFANTFLEKCHLSKMITKYIVLHDTDKMLMVLRPYQFFAVERIIDKVKNSNHNGYIWHTTGSGKTLTSFKASQILSQLPKVDKVVFCVDRQDLDYQTAKEFNAFKPDCIDPTKNTKNLVRQFNDSNNKLIVTTIQKLYNAITKEHHLKTMNDLKDKKIVFIFDECHRSQFGDTHKKITQYFNNYQMFGFTGTPIFADNAVSKSKENQTTASLFGTRLHQYVITDAIKDENVLRFSVEYVGKYREKENSQNEIDIEVEAIDTKELMESPQRIEKIANYIIQQHPIKTQNKTFTAMFCLSSVEVLIKYYDLFQKLKQEGKHNLQLATIFSFGANDDMINDIEDFDSKDFNQVAESTDNEYNVQHKRDKLERYIAQYNTDFGTKYHTKDSEVYYNYYKDIAQRVKNKQIDILFVVNMFLTGFDSKTLNTLYVDKNLKHHGLIQAYSRTNRILGEKKSQGNIVVFRNLKKATDDAIALFSNKEAKEIIIMQPYEKYVKDINEAYQKLISIVPNFEAVDDLYTEEEELEFIKAFRDIIRLKNVISSYVDFTFEDIEIDEQEFENYKSKYLDLYDKNNNTKDKTSIINEVDFELELIHRDDITVSYILALLANLKVTTLEEKERKQKEILDLVAGETKLRSKRELIEKFIIENLPLIQTENIEEDYNAFMDAEKQKAFHKFVEDEQLNPEKLQKLTEDYLFSQRTPTKQEVVDVMENQPSILQRATVGDIILSKFMNFVNTFFND
jgi:type I restriction enzyme R subunit